MTAESINRHQSCHWYQQANFNRSQIIAGTSAQIFDLGILSSCRQVYHEAKHILYTNKTFSFSDPKTLRCFMYVLQQAPSTNTLSIRKTHLEMKICEKFDEHAWNAALRVMSQRLLGLTQLHIIIEQRFRVENSTSPCPYPFKAFQDPNAGSNSFLRGLYHLKDLPIETLTIVVGGTGLFYRFPAHRKKPGVKSHGWTHGERQVWSRFVRDSILKKIS